MFLGIKDDHVLYSYTKDSPWNNFSCFLGEKNRLEGPILKYYSRYIRHRFVFFLPEVNVKHFLAKQIYTSTILDYL
jgi:Txe/YoeB family toxin of Txe-Axe toxin-antitoxin module